MHYHVWGSHHAKFDDDDFNRFWGIDHDRHTCTRTHTYTQTRSQFYSKVCKVAYIFANKNKRERENFGKRFVFSDFHTERLHFLQFSLVHCPAAVMTRMWMRLCNESSIYCLASKNYFIFHSHNNHASMS